MMCFLIFLYTFKVVTKISLILKTKLEELAKKAEALRTYQARLIKSAFWNALKFGARLRVRCL